MNNLQLFNFEGNQVRIVLINNTPIFVGPDVTTILGYSNSRKALADHVDDEDKILLTSRNVTLENMPNRGITGINESGLYSLILSSKMPNAKKFKHWVTSEVLPSIRKHGAYLTDTKIEEVLTSPDTIIKLATQLKDERKQREELQVANNQLKDRIVKDAPNVTFAKAVTASNHNISVGEMADILTQNGFSIGRNQLYQLLRITKYLGTKGAIYNLPTSQMAKRGYFRVAHSVDKYGNAHSTTKVTPKGQKHLINKALRGSFDDDYQRVMVSTLAI